MRYRSVVICKDIYIFFFGGGRSRRGKRREGWVWGGGVSLPTGEGVWGGGTAPSPEISPEKFFLILNLKMAICGAFLVHFYAVQLKL